MAAANKADPSGKPPPDVAAILELLNEIKRELTADATEAPPPPARVLAEPAPVQKPATPIPPVVAPPVQVAAPEPPKIEPAKPEAAKPVPPKPAADPVPVPPKLSAQLVASEAGARP